MALSFSQRRGLTPIRTALQIDSMDIDLKNRLWNIIYQNILPRLSDQHYILIWSDFFKNRIDEIPKSKFRLDDDISRIRIAEYLKKWIYQDVYYCIYDFIEYILPYFIDENYFDPNDFDDLILCFNNALEVEKAGYRIIGGLVTQITSEEEIKEIEYAIEDTNGIGLVNKHLKTALELFADRKNPDYRNSIKESISAVEAYCRIIVNDKKATLGEALKNIEKHCLIHPSLKSAFSALYGYSSDSGGIRHAMKDGDVEPDFEDAKFMLVSCSAFINYLKAKVVKTEK